jgi:sec-independent protein translocase protein TatC
MSDPEHPEENPNLPVKGSETGLQQPARGKKFEMPFLDHLEELRWRLIKALAAIIVAAIVCYAFANTVLTVLTYPYYDAVHGLESARAPGSVQAIRDLIERWTGQEETPATPVPDTMEGLPANRKLQALRPLTIFYLELQIALMGGFAFALPIIFLQLWRFIAPGLLASEKRLVLPIISLSTLCFFIGTSIAYWIVLPLGLRFFLGLESENTTSQWAVDEYISFVLKLLLGFGVVFQMPVLALFLARIGLLTADYLRRVRRFAIIIVFVLGAFFTPPDPISQVLMALPLLVLYEVSIWICRVAGKKATVEET